MSWPWKFYEGVTVDLSLKVRFENVDGISAYFRYLIMFSCSDHKSVIFLPEFLINLKFFCNDCRLIIKLKSEVLSKSQICVQGWSKIYIKGVTDIKWVEIADLLISHKSTKIIYFTCFYYLYIRKKCSWKRQTVNASGLKRYVMQKWPIKMKWICFASRNFHRNKWKMNRFQNIAKWQKRLKTFSLGRISNVSISKDQHKSHSKGQFPSKSYFHTFFFPEQRINVVVFVY